MQCTVLGSRRNVVEQSETEAFNVVKRRKGELAGQAIAANRVADHWNRRSRAC